MKDIPADSLSPLYKEEAPTEDGYYHIAALNLNGKYDEKIAVRWSYSYRPNNSYWTIANSGYRTGSGRISERAMMFRSTYKPIKGMRNFLFGPKVNTFPQELI